MDVPGTFVNFQHEINESKSIYVLNSYPNNTQIDTKLGKWIG
ncbi:hypothetical protein METP2_01493 [Methanosarcinales archaeon]|nr:hypothetical protein METP2_01493 [Methanosarcinales archaeon]